MNKRGGVGGKILLVIILMLLAAAGGAYGYRVMDGKLAVRDAEKLIKDIDIEDYDTEEAAQLQVYLNSISKDLETAKTRKEVYEITSEFKEEVAKIQTKAEKELEAAKKEAEEARRLSQQNANNGSTTDSTQNTQSLTDDQNNSPATENTLGSGLTEAEDGTEGSGGLLNSLFGSNND